MSESFPLAAAARVGAEPPPAAAGGGLLASSDFFAREGGAPLLRRNAGFLRPEGLPAGWRERLDGWAALAGAASPAEEVCRARSSIERVHPATTIRRSCHARL